MALECQGFTCGAFCCLCPRNTLHAQLSYLPRFEHVAQCSSHRLQGKSRATDACIDCSTKPTGSSSDYFSLANPIARAYLAESNRVAYGIDAVFDTDDFGRCHAVISGHVRTDEKSSRSAILDYTGKLSGGLPKALTGSSITQSAEKIPIGADAVATVRPEGSRPRLLVFVVGETARAQNWGLNGYARETTPQLTQMGVINFSDMHSCGTNTEVSVPCMFSSFGRRNYDEDKIRSHQSLLHVLERAGITTLWRDNQSGCKGVCDGLEYQSLGNAQSSSLCVDGRCFDEILLEDLPAQARKNPGDRVIFLHQLGNHGPSYFQRYPAAYRKFIPTCDTPEMGKCTREQIVNSYDNAILYTDHFLTQVIKKLQGLSDYDTAMIFVSDHGESLGEKGLFLHGMPYAIAPQEQTRVPLVMWFSSTFTQSRGLNIGCLSERARSYANHDALFSSVLGLMQVKTSEYDRNFDFFFGCDDKNI